MKVSFRTIAAVSAAFFTIAPAVAADIPLPYKAAPAVPAFSWTGCYVGGNAGGGRGLNDWLPFEGVLPLNAVHSSGWLAGAQAGCDYQVGAFVVGVEGQFDWTGLKGTTPTFISNSGGVTALLTSKPDRIATATGRVGYAFDRVLLYAKGGAAFAHLRQEFTQTNFADQTQTLSGNQDIAGFVAGGGLEFALLPNVSLRAEYNYFDFGRNGLLTTCAACGAGGAAATAPFEIKQSIQTFTLGLNYRFGGPH